MAYTHKCDPRAQKIFEFGLLCTLKTPKSHSVGRMYKFVASTLRAGKQEQKGVLESLVSQLILKEGKKKRKESLQTLFF